MDLASLVQMLLLAHKRRVNPLWKTVLASNKFSSSIFVRTFLYFMLVSGIILSPHWQSMHNYYFFLITVK